MASAMTGPTPSTCSISSSPAARSAGMSPKWRATCSAVTKPTCGMPSANRTRAKGRSHELAIEASTFSAERSWNPSSGSRSSSASL